VNHRVKFGLRILTAMAVMALVVWAFTFLQASERFP
jgi:hypothetical protein